MGDVVITGIGMVTPLGDRVDVVLERIRAGETAFNRPKSFDADSFACQLAAELADLDPERFVPDIKIVRLMNRDALLAVAAGQLAMEDAGIIAGQTYSSNDIGLFGSTGLAGVPLDEVAPLLRHSADPDGRFDTQRFGSVALKRVRPVLTFKILSNMPICFVSIFQQIQGVNAVYTPWEGQGAQAIIAGIRAVARGQASCALVGGCDVKTHELGFVSLQQHGVFDSWKRSARGTVPGEGAGFLILENRERALARKARIYAKISEYALTSVGEGENRCDAYGRVLSGLSQAAPQAVVAGADGDPDFLDAESSAMLGAGIDSRDVIRPKQHLGNLFAAAAVVQLAIGAKLVRERGRVLANCFGHGGQQAAFVLEAA